MLLPVIGLLVQLAAAEPPSDDQVLRDARAAQARFERVRRAHLPVKPAFGTSRHCDARIGRYCYWYDSTQRDVVPEPRRIIEARRELLAELDSAASQVPADAWIAGQRTRYLLETGNWQEAASAARVCQAGVWWCAALQGLALHVGERYSDADSLFSLALSSMPSHQRCEWTDLKDVADDRWLRVLERASCADRERIAERMWKLSQPLWIADGNDLRTEHLARRTMAAILEHSLHAHSGFFGNDSRELLMRYGWAEWYTRHESGASLSMVYQVVGHDREPSYYFFPDVPSPSQWHPLATTSWRLRDPAARTRYAPRHVKALGSMPHQLARFPRGDSVLLAAAYAIHDTALAADSVVAALALYGRGDVRVVRGNTPASVVTATIGASDTVVASVEAHGRTTRRAARARFTIDPLPCQGGWCLSDILFIDPTRVAVAAPDAEEAIHAAMTRTSVSRGTPIGVFWELSGTPSPRPVTLSLTVEPLRVSVARRVASRLHLVAPASAVRLRWQTVQHGERTGQQVTLRLPETARGRYRVVLTVDRDGAAPLSASREIDIGR